MQHSSIHKEFTYFTQKKHKHVNTEYVLIYIQWKREVKSIIMSIKNVKNLHTKCFFCIVFCNETLPDNFN